MKLAQLETQKQYFLHFNQSLRLAYFYQPNSLEKFNLKNLIKKGYIKK